MQRVDHWADFMMNVTAVRTEREPAGVANQEDVAVMFYPNTPAQGQLPSQLPSPLYVNLGCGNDVRDGFINIDLFGNHPNVIPMDVVRSIINVQSAGC